MSKDEKREPPKPIAPGIPVTATGQVISGEVTKDYQKILYTPERQEMLMKGELNLKDYHAISGPEMLQMAMIGFRMYESGKYAEAETIFNGLIMLDPMESYYYTAAGAVYLALEQYDRAKHNFDHAIAFNPKELAAYVNRGEANLRMGNIMEAATDFKSAVDLDPTGKDPLALRARILAAAALELIEGAQGGEQEEPAKKEPAKKAEAPKKPAAPAKKK